MNMLRNIRITLKNLVRDTLGEDLAEVSSGLSKGAKACIACGAIVATAYGANALSNAANDTSDKAAVKVGAPIGGGQNDKSEKTTSVYKQ
jgi:hypothetical protein